MKVIVKTIGKLKSADLLSLIKVYQKRFSGELLFEEHEVKKKLSGDALKSAEGELLLQKLPAEAFVIALDERGKSFTSPDFAALLQQQMLAKGGSFVFLIGGADGHSPQVRDRADLLLSFGKMTWPHMMVRLMLAEQLYRTQQIMAGHPYHKV